MTLATKKLRTAWASAPADEEILETIELRHSQFSRRWLLTSHPTKFSATLEDGSAVEFTPLPFAVKLPASDAQGGQLLDITLANAGADMVDEIEAAGRKPDERIDVVYRVFLGTDKTAPQNDPIALSIDSLTMNNEAIVAVAGRSDVLNHRFPSILYAVDMFPGLDR